VLKRRSSWLRAAVPAAVLAMALTACGSEDSSDESGSGPADASADGGSSADQESGEDAEQSGDDGVEQQSTEDPAEAGDGASADGEDSGGNGYPPDTLVYQLGETSEAVPFEDANGNQADLRVTAERIDVGAPEDLADAYGDEASGMKPAAVYLNVEHAGGATLEDMLIGRLTTLSFVGDSAAENPATPQGNVDIPGGCTEEMEPTGPLAEGDEAALCVLILLPEDAEPADVNWGTVDGPPVVWQNQE
jgi:hypothetical protein